MALSPEQKIMFEVVGDFRASTTDGMSSYVCITLSGVAVYEPPRVATNIQVNLHFIPLQLLNYSIIDWFLNYLILFSCSGYIVSNDMES